MVTFIYNFSTLSLLGCMYKCVRMFVCLFAYIYTVCICVRTICVYLYACVYIVCVHLCMCLCVFVCVYMFASDLSVVVNNSV